MSNVRVPAALEELIGDLDAVVFAAVPVDDQWDSVRSELLAAYETSRVGARDQLPIVYVVSSDALLGRSGPGNAMVATGLLSAARTLAAELTKAAVPVNVVGVASDTPDEVTAEWIGMLASAGPFGPTGELIQLGGGQIGKALP